MQTTGAKISAIGHTVLIGWLILGWGLDSDPFPFEVSEVSVVSSEEYASIVAASTPTPGTDEPVAPAPPATEEAPDVPVAEAAPAEVTPPTPTEQPTEEAPPPSAIEPPAPPADVADSAPLEPAPPEASADLTVSPRPQNRPSEIIAPTPVAPPPPDTAVAEIVQDAVVPDEVTPAEVVEPAVEATAPEEAAAEIVIADETPSGAVLSSPRPQSRPNRPAPTPTVAPRTESETASASSANVAAEEAAVAAALEAALAATSSPTVPAGPPMTGSEKEGFRVAVNACWNVDPGSQAARVTMVVAFSLDQSGKVSGEVRKVSASGGDAGAEEIAFQAARRAILRCQSGGYQLPADKYDQWKDVEITFDPSGMRMR